MSRIDQSAARSPGYSGASEVAAPQPPAAQPIGPRESEAPPVASDSVDGPPPPEMAHVLGELSPGQIQHLAQNLAPSVSRADLIRAYANLVQGGHWSFDWSHHHPMHTSPLETPGLDHFRVWGSATLFPTPPGTFQRLRDFYPDSGAVEALATLDAKIVADALAGRPTSITTADIDALMLGVADTYSEANELGLIVDALKANIDKLDPAGRRMLAVLEKYLEIAQARDGGYLLNAEKFGMQIELRNASIPKLAEPSHSF